MLVSEGGLKLKLILSKGWVALMREPSQGRETEACIHNDQGACFYSFLSPLGSKMSSWLAQNDSA